MGLDIIVQKKKELGLTNEELAHLSGIPKGTIDKILSGVTKDPGDLKSYCQGFRPVPGRL